ncbi:MAG: hypothetical protein AAF657_02490 [Acidobacteriota bacterium]
MVLLRYFADDPDFYGLLDHFIEQVATRHRPHDLFLVRIDNWFDWKWLGFAGTEPLDTASLFGPIALPTVTQGVWSSGAETTVPPFTPSRIVQQQHFHCGDGSIGRPSKPVTIHPADRRRTEPKAEPRILDISADAWFFWLSSDSASSGRGSLLAYRAKDQVVHGWYAAFERTRSSRWVVSRSKNVNREALAALFDRYYGD